MNRLGHTIGWWGAPSVWALNTQLGQTLPHADCIAQHSWSAMATSLTLTVSVFAAGWSAHIAGDLSGTQRFVALSGSGISSIVGFAVLLQGAAILVIDPCLR